MVQYAPYLVQSFPERRKAEDWAKKKKDELRTAGYGSSKIDIDFNNKSGEWQAKILIPME